MGFKNNNLVQKIKRLMYAVPASLALLIFSYGSTTSVIAAGPEAHLKGEFGPLHAWPIVPVHMTLMPDGRVFAFGPQSLKDLKYAVWDPALGTSASAFETLPNTTGTSIFCAGQAMISETGQALLIGGDTSYAMPGTNYGYHTEHVNVYDPTTDMLIPQTSMAYSRWYATAVTLPNGGHLALGGRNVRPSTGILAEYAPIPEVRALDGSWRSLSAASSDAAYGAAGGNSWYYPRAWVNPQGNVFIVNPGGALYKLTTAGAGTLTLYNKRIPAGRNLLPSAMFSPGRILLVRNNRAAIIVDINGTGEPTSSSGGSLSRDRKYGNATVLADGRVWVNGGSSTGNDLVGAALDSELWNPVTNTWTTTASAATVRLYHSAALLLADGTVLTGGGGVPGPLRQMNGEVYYPPYLFKKDGTGEFAPRPEIVDAPSAMIGWNQVFSVEATENIARITLVRAGAVTHAFNNEQRFFDLPPISQSGNSVTVKSPASINSAPPGFYLLFVWNAAGTPSLAKIIHLG